MPTDPQVSGEFDQVNTTPAWEATGGRSIRARQVHTRHIKLLDNFQTELGDDVGRREAIAALLEYYDAYPERVLREVKGPQTR